MSLKEKSGVLTPRVYEYQAGGSNWKRAWGDIKEGWARRQLWTDMTLRDFKNRYKGAGFGVFWLTITTAMTASGLGILYGYLFGRPLEVHLPYVTCAIVTWSMITGFGNGGAGVFVGSAFTFKEFPLPLSLFPLRLALNQVLHFGYRAIVLVAVIILFSVPLYPIAFLSLVGLAMLVWIGFWMSMVLGIINARYRDFGQLVAAGLTFSFFVTPVFWVPERLGDFAVYVNFNPFYHFLEVIRGPILLHDNLQLHFAVTAGFALIAPMIGWFVYGRLSHRLPYWC